MRTLFSFLFIMLGGLSSHAQEKPTKPNVVLILMDDMGWADGECFGSRFYETPALNLLATQSVRFTSAYASCAVCSPTRAALMTGKAPARLHLTDWIAGEGAPKGSRFTIPNWTQRLPLEEVTLAEAFKKLGYTTGHLGKWHLGGEGFEPERQGFDVNIGGGHIGHPGSYFWPYGQKGSSHRVPHLAENGGQEGEYLTDRLTDEALHFITANKDRPFFLNLAHYAVHGPFQGKKELIDKAADRAPANGQANLTYAAMIKSMDESLGRVLAKLEELGLAGKTIVVFTSDNGGVVHAGKPVATSNAPLRKGKGFAYEGGLRVPLLVRIPGLARPGSATDEPVISTDLFPTLMELVGAPANAAATAVDGVSFAGLLRGGKAPARDTFFWHYPHYWNGGEVNPYSVVRSGSWKLIRFYETGREELYNLASDLSETNDLAGSSPAKVSELVQKLDAWLKGVDAQIPVPRRRLEK